MLDRRAIIWALSGVLAALAIELILIFLAAVISFIVFLPAGLEARPEFVE